MAQSRARPLSLVLLVLGCLAILFGTLTLYARERVLSADQFSSKAVSTLDDSDVRDAAARRITNGLIHKVDPNLVTVRPLIEAGSAALLDTGAFKSIFGTAVTGTYNGLVGGNDDALVTVANIGVLLTQALRQYDPQAAKKIPKGFDTRLVRLGEGKGLAKVARVVDQVRVLGLVLVPLAIVLLAGSIAVDRDRRRAVILAGAGLAIVALLALTVLAVAHAVMRGEVDGETDRGAFDAVWDAFLNPLRNWYVGIGVFGVVVLSAAASALRPRDHPALLGGAWERVAVEPVSTRGRLLWAAGLAVAGILMIAEPDFVLHAALFLAGAYLLSRAIATVIALASEPVTAERSRMERRRILVWSGVGIAISLLAGAILIAVLSGGGGGGNAQATTGKGCNGSKALCDRRLDQVTFPATHNSYAGANYPGFLFAGQENTIPQQLEAGIRGLWIDTYYGVPGRRVYTDTAKVSPALISQLDDQLGPKFTAAGNRIRSQVARPPANAPTKIYLCHGFCELGAVEAGQAFRQIADFLDQNPNEVLIIDIEDYTTPKDTQHLIRSTGLAKYVYKGPSGPPWPTLQEMIDSGGRVLLLAEHMTGGASWYRPLNSNVQETPFQFKTPQDMTCRGGRGSRSATLFLINNWIDTDPTPKPTNAERVNAYRFLLRRARECERQRGLFPNVLNVDFYKEGDLFGVAKRLNHGG
jgi:hypothetical protein